MVERRRPLFLPRPPEGCDDAYRVLCQPSSPRSVCARELCEEFWTDFRDLADAAFLDRLPFEFHQRWFEMYLGTALRRAGLDVSARKPGPDLQVLHGEQRIHIEAIAPSAGNPLHADAVPEPVYRDADGELIAVQVPHDQITLRIAHAFRAKAGVFDRYRQRAYVREGERCIIAINLRAIPHAWADAAECWYRALYGVGDRFVAIDPAGGAITAGRNHRALLHRVGGAAEDVAPLLRQENCLISGVLGSSADVGNVPNLPGDDFMLMPHASPNAPYPQGLLHLGGELVLHADGGERWNVEAIDYGAHETRGPEPIVAELDGVAIEGEWAVEGRILSVSVGGSHCDVPLAGGDNPEESARAIAIEIARARGSRGETRE